MVSPLRLCESYTAVRRGQGAACCGAANGTCWAWHWLAVCHSCLVRSIHSLPPSHQQLASVHPLPVSHLKAGAASSASQTCSALPGTNCSCCIAAGLYAGSTELTRDFATVVLRIYSLGFNSIRLLTSFTTLFTLPAVPQGSSCTPVDVATIQSFVTDPNAAPTSDAFFPQTLQVRHGLRLRGQLSLLM